MTLNNKNIREAVATAAATSSLWGPKALGAIMTGVGAVGTMYQSKKWDELERPKRGKPINLNPAPSDNPDTIRMRKNRAKAKEEKELKRKEANKENLKRTIEDLYGPIPEHVNWREELKAK